MCFWHLLYAQWPTTYRCIYFGFSLWLIFIFMLLQPTSLPCFLCCHNTYFPSCGSIKLHLVLSNLKYLSIAGITRQTLMDLSVVFYSFLFCSKAIFSKQGWMIPSHLCKNNYQTRPLSCGVFAGSSILSLCHVAINSSFTLAECCSHSPLMPLQPSLHDNEDLRHKARERYDMWAAF